MVLDALFLRLLVTVDEAAELGSVLAAEDTADVLTVLEAEAEAEAEAEDVLAELEDVWTELEDVLAELEAEDVLELGAALDLEDTVEL